jgi:DNA-binding response OmpR family regulator
LKSGDKNKKKTIYVIDDEQGIKMIESMGIEDEAELKYINDSDNICYESLKKEENIVLLINASPLPNCRSEMSGLGILEKLRFNNVKAPVIIYSAFNKDLIKENFPIVEAPGTFFLQMPFVRHKLSELIRIVAPLKDEEIENVKVNFCNIYKILKNLIHNLSNDPKEDLVEELSSVLQSNFGNRFLNEIKEIRSYIGKHNKKKIREILQKISDDISNEEKSGVKGEILPKSAPVGLKHILIYDDQDYPEQTVKELKALGYKISIAKTQDEAVRILAYENPDVYLGDLYGSGSVLLKRQDERWESEFEKQKGIGKRLLEFAQLMGVKLVIAMTAAPQIRDDEIPIGVLKLCGPKRKFDANAIHKIIWNKARIGMLSQSEYKLGFQDDFLAIDQVYRALGDIEKSLPILNRIILELLNSVSVISAKEKLERFKAVLCELIQKDYPLMKRNRELKKLLTEMWSFLEKELNNQRFVKNIKEKLENCKSIVHRLQNWLAQIRLYRIKQIAKRIKSEVKETGYFIDWKDTLEKICSRLGKDEIKKITVDGALEIIEELRGFFIRELGWRSESISPREYSNNIDEYGFVSKQPFFIIIIEDDELWRKEITRFLQNMFEKYRGFFDILQIQERIVELTSYKEAIEYFQNFQSRLAIVILDLGLPESKGDARIDRNLGFKILQEIRSFKLNLPTIILTIGENLLQEHLLTYRQGVEKYLLKDLAYWEQELESAILKYVCPKKRNISICDFTESTIIIDGVVIQLEPKLFKIFRKLCLKEIDEEASGDLYPGEVYQDPESEKNISKDISNIRSKIYEAFKQVGRFIIPKREVLIKVDSSYGNFYRVRGNIEFLSEPPRYRLEICRVFMFTSQKEAKEIGEFLTYYRYHIDFTNNFEELDEKLRTFKPHILCIDLDCIKNKDKDYLSRFSESIARIQEEIPFKVIAFASEEVANNDDMLRKFENTLKPNILDIIIKSNEEFKSRLFLSIYNKEVELITGAVFPIIDPGFELPIIEIKKSGNTVRINNNPLKLTRKRFDLLFALCEAWPFPVGKESLQKAVYKKVNEKSAFNSLVDDLRKKLGCCIKLKDFNIIERLGDSYRLNARVIIEE